MMDATGRRKLRPRGTGICTAFTVQRVPAKSAAVQIFTLSPLRW
jgi:hypothetical protein